MNSQLIESVYFAKHHFSALFRILGPFVVAMALVGSAVSFNGDNLSSLYWLYLVVYGFAQAFFTCRLIRYLAAVVGKRDYDPNIPTPLWLNLFLVHVLYSLAVLLGLIALIIPGLYIAARYGFAEFEAVLNGKSPFEALNISWKESQPVVLTLFFGGIFVAASTLVITYPLTIIDQQAVAANFMATFVSEIISSCSLILMSIFYFRVYVSASE